MVELMVTMGIIGLLVAVALPSFLAWKANARVKAVARGLLSDFQLAKMEAAKRNAPVVLDFTAGTYAPQGAVGSYRVFVDDGAGGGTAGNWTRDGGEAVLEQVAMPPEVSLYLASFSLGASAAGFNARGLPIANRVGNVRIRNDALFYRISLSIAGHVGIEESDHDFGS
jgi:hypothetical protein